ncbi:MAG: hypothetical protein K2Q09_01685, partial [Phycisphaerales bacterium]|nr:hypothetical protein [Phycisphaerales bacterium]
MVACVVVCVCGVLIGQPPTVPPADSGKGQAAAAAPAAGLEGPWKVGEARCYRVSDKTTVMPNTPDRGQEDSGSAALIECLLRFTPVELGPFEQRFALAVMEVKGDLPTPLGRAVFNTGGAGGGDKLSRAMEVAASRVLQTKMVVTVKGGHVASITGNEALDDPSAPGAEVMALLGGDRALLDRCRWCLSLERGAAEGAEGSWRTSFDLDYRELYGVFLPARLAREKTEGGVTVYALSPAGKPAARQKADRERAAHGRSISAQVGDGLAEGRLRWSDADGRLESGSLTVGCTAERNVDGVRSADRQERTLTFMRGPAPEAGTGVRGGPPVPPPPPDWEGPWAVGKSKDYRVTTEAVEVLTSPDNPGHRTQKRSTDVLTVRIVPVSLEGGRREFRVTPLSLSLEVPTPFGRVALDTAGAPPGDEMSSALY